MILTNGDLPTNPISLRECAVCGGVFTREQSQEHYYVPCPPSSYWGICFPHPIPFCRIFPMDFLTRIFLSMPLRWWIALILSVLGIAAICLRVLESDGVLLSIA